jgi:hypothetical protein
MKRIFVALLLTLAWTSAHAGFIGLAPAAAKPFATLTGASGATAIPIVGVLWAIGALIVADQNCRATPGCKPDDDVYRRLDLSVVAGSGLEMEPPVAK